MAQDSCIKKDMDVSFRWATLDDYEAVKNISGYVYKGLDYMLDGYPDIIQHPLFYGVVGEIENEVVAFVGGYVQNNNTRLITKGGRVSEIYRDQGIYKRLLTYLLAELKIKFPSLKTQQFFCGTTNPAVDKLAKNKTYTELFRQGIWLFKPPKELVQTPPITCSQLDRGSFKTLLSKTNIATDLFPHKIFVKWEMCDPVVDELDFIFSHEPFILHSEHNGVCIVTIGGVRRSTFGVAYIIQCHVTSSADFIAVEQILQVHVNNHVEAILHELTNESRLVLIIPQNHAHSLKQAALKQGLTQIPFFNDSFIVYSQDM